MLQEAAFSKRITEESGVEVIGGADKYMAVCRRCYFSPNNVNKYKFNYKNKYKHKYKNKY